MKPRLRDDRGVAAIEFVILGPVLALILGAVLEVGSLVQTVAVVRNAAREGARYASVSAPPPNPNPTIYATGAQAYAVMYLQASLAGRDDVTLSSATATLSPSNGAAPGLPVSLTVSVPLTIGMPIIRETLGSTITLTSSATMEVI